MNPNFYIWRKSVTFKPRQDKTRHDKAWQSKARRGETRQDEAAPKQEGVPWFWKILYLTMKCNKLMEINEKMLPVQYELESQRDAISEALNQTRDQFNDSTVENEWLREMVQEQVITMTKKMEHTQIRLKYAFLNYSHWMSPLAR